MGVQYCGTGGLAAITCVLIVKHRVNFVENPNSRGEIPKFGGKAILRKRKAGVHCSSMGGLWHGWLGRDLQIGSNAPSLI